ncbi:MAG: PA0069 family radical SAM protein [Pseudomonadota bacterium]
MLFSMESTDPNDAIPQTARHGRGATRNPTGRFEPHRRGHVDDGWDGPEAAPVRTEVHEDSARRVITRNASPDVPFDRSINPYKGCEHGCIYCFARPTHAYLGLSPGLDFETKLFKKSNAAELLANELRRPGYRPATIAIGTNTDPYQPIERDTGIMRRILAVLAEHNHPVSIVTKGALVTRDIDILGPMGRKGLAKVALSLTTLDTKLCRTMEPRASAPHARLRAIATLAKAGVPVGVATSPIIAGLNDHEIESLLEAGAKAGASWANFVTLRLPHEVSPLFRDWIRTHYPNRANKIMGKVREMHGGRDYDPQWGKRMRGEGVYAALIARRFDAARRRLGLRDRTLDLDCSQFRVPPRPGDQLSLL